MRVRSSDQAFIGRIDDRQRVRGFVFHTMNILVTPRLLLRPLTMGDLDEIVALYSDQDVMLHIPPLQTPEEIQVSLQQTISRFDEHGWGVFAMIERREKRFIGCCGLQQLETTQMMEMVFTLAKSAWGKGYAIEASKLLLRKAFSDWSLETVFAIVQPGNTSWSHIMEKLGMQYVRNGEYYQKNCALYALEKPSQLPKRPFREKLDFFREYATVS